MKSIVEEFELEFDGISGYTRMHKSEIEKIQFDIASLRAENAEMLEALEDVWNDCEAAAKKGHAATFDAIRQPTFEKVKKSIAKAKPRP